jgi:membrane fusion protein (multidrug efflux system)
MVGIYLRKPRFDTMVWMLSSPNLSGRRGPAGGHISRQFRVAWAALAATAGVSCGLFFAVLVTGCSVDGENGKGGHGPPPITVEVTRVEPTLLQDVATFSGQLDAEQSVVLRSEADGVVASVEFEEGQDVSEGDVLYKLRDIEQRARLREARANLALARNVQNRTIQLYERDAVSIADRDRAAAELEVVKARVDVAKLEFERTRIRAPFDGAVGMRLVDTGDRVDDKTPLVQVDAIDRLQAIFAMSEHGVAFARPGIRVWLEVAPYPGERFAGEIFFISPSIDPATRRLFIKAWVPNDDRRLRPGLFTNIDVEIAQRDHALLVPESAVVFDRHGTFVWRLADDNVATRAPIDTGLRKGGTVEVTMGLQPGDTIVTAGTHKVAEGKTVIIKTPASSGQALRDDREDPEAGAGT